MDALKRSLAVLSLLLCLEGVLTTNGSGVTHETLQGDHQALRQIVENIKENLEDVEDDVEDVAEDVEDVEDEIEGLDDKVHNIETTFARGVASLQGEVRTMKNDLETGQQKVREKVASSTQSLRESNKRIDEEISVLKEGNQALKNETVEIKEELVGLQRDMNSTLYLLQELRNQLLNLSQENSATSCSKLPLNSLSGYYWLRGASERVYCDMDRQSCGCGSTCGWMRVAHIDMTDPNQQCPEGFSLRSGSPRLCETIVEDIRPRPVGDCTSMVFPTHRVQYRHVCGRVKAYQYATPDGFNPYSLNRSKTIDSQYVDGLSITHGQSPRKHIWTFVSALDETRSDSYTCPCIKTTRNFTGVVPPFIGNDYFCDTGSRSRFSYGTFYIDDPLWDGAGCGSTNACCQFNSPPWFCKELPQPTTDDIEVRVCRNENRSNEDTPFEQIELYVK